jgi:hypothetical protein
MPLDGTLFSTPLRGKALKVSMQQNIFSQANSVISFDSVAGYPYPFVITKYFKRHLSRRSIRLHVKLRLIAYVLLFLHASFVVFFVSGGFAQVQQAPPKKHVLVLHGVSRIRAWEIPFNSNLHSALLAEKKMTMVFTHEYLALDDFPDNVYPKRAIDDLRDKVKMTPVDLVKGVAKNSVKLN